MKSYLGVLPLLAAVMCGCGENAGVDAYRERVGEGGVLHFEIDADAPLSTGTNDLRISIREVTTNEPVRGAKVGLFAIMPAMAHDSPPAPEIEDLGAGTYLAPGVALPMPGRWEVHVHATLSNRHDHVTFAYDLP